MGEEPILTDMEGKQLKLPRYGVWGDTGRGKPEVIETHSDLARMQQEHGVPDSRIFSVARTAK